jgi:hypothetical protein
MRWSRFHLHGIGSLLVPHFRTANRIHFAEKCSRMPIHDPRMAPLSRLLRHVSGMCLRESGVQG